MWQLFTSDMLPFFQQDYFNNNFQRFYVKNLWKFISQMGNPLGVHETNYKIKKVKQAGAELGQAQLAH